MTQLAPLIRCFNSIFFTGKEMEAYCNHFFKYMVTWGNLLTKGNEIKKLLYFDTLVE